VAISAFVEGLAVGTRDKLLLIEVDGQRVLLGMSPGRIATLHTFAGEPAPQFDDALRAAGQQLLGGQALMRGLLLLLLSGVERTGKRRRAGPGRAVHHHPGRWQSDLHLDPASAVADDGADHVAGHCCWP
jgi:hypothetical protein